jgi:hypothetical protein
MVVPSAGEPTECAFVVKKKERNFSPAGRSGTQAMIMAEGNGPFAMVADVRTYMNILVWLKGKKNHPMVANVRRYMIIL